MWVLNFFSDIFPLLQQGRFSDKMETERNRRTGENGKRRKIAETTLQKQRKGRVNSLFCP